MSSSFFSSVMEFLSTPSARRATLTSSSQKTVQMIFLSTPSARRATLTLILTVDGHIISIHALREEGDLNCPLPSAGNKRFLSTPSARRATSAGHICTFTARFLSTPSARRATLAITRRALVTVYFYPRPPRGGRPRKIFDALMKHCISIHALREEGDLTLRGQHVDKAHFYPRPPRGGRQVKLELTYLMIEFLSTPSARRATGDGSLYAVCRSISIHALREEGDSKNGEKHLRFCFIIKRSAQIWKSLSKNIQKNSCDLHRTA